MSRLSDLTRSCVSALLLFSVPLAASATGEQSGLITFETGQYGSYATSAGYTFFHLSGTKTGSPACAPYNRWVINNDWPVAKIQIATLLTAFAMGRSVSVVGSNNCAVWSDTETAVDIRIL